jgi:hypothetical protein
MPAEGSSSRRKRRRLDIEDDFTVFPDLSVSLSLSLNKRVNGRNGLGKGTRGWGMAVVKTSDRSEGRPKKTRTIRAKALREGGRRRREEESKKGKRKKWLD